MSQKHKKQFGIWMDNHHAVVVGRGDGEEATFEVIGHAGNEGARPNSSEKTEHNDEKTLQHKFFKEILSHMQNADEVHVTGTGTAQEQLMKYMSETPQYKHTVTTESTSNKMSDESFVKFIDTKFN